MGKQWKQWDFLFLGSKITADGDCSHEIKRRLFLGGASLVAQTVKRLSAMLETWVRSLGRKDPLEKEMATHSSTPAWKIPWTEEPGRLQSVWLQRVRHDWATLVTFLTPWKKSYAQPQQHIKKQSHDLPTKVCLVKAIVFPVVMYGCESWTIKKAEPWRIDAFELWCWRRLLRVPWTARRSY